MDNLIVPTPELIAKLKEILASNTNTVRDVRTPDARIYHHVRLGQFECVVDNRDCPKEQALEYAMMHREQPWYYDPKTNNDPPVVTTISHSQYVQWLRSL